MKVVLEGKVIGVSSEPREVEGTLGVGRMLINAPDMPNAPRPPAGFDFVDDDGNVIHHNCFITGYACAFQQEDGSVVVLEDVDFVTGE